MTDTLQKEEIVVREILDTARTLFRQFGFKKTTMGDIARNLGRGKSSLYYYYPSKEDIFEAVIHVEMDELLDQIQQSIRSAATSREKLIIYCKLRLNKLTELYNLSDAFKSEIAELHCIITDLKSKFDTTHLSLVKEILEEGMKNKEFRKINPKNIALVAYVMVSSFRGLAMPLMVSSEEYPVLDEQIDSIIDILVEGIA